MNKRETAWLALLSFLLCVPLMENELYYYFVFIIMSGLKLFCFNLSGENGLKFRLTKREKIVFFFPLLMVFVWLNAMFIGIIKSNPTAYIFRNFAGVLCYFFFYVLLFNNEGNKKILFNYLYKASIISTIYAAISFFVNKYNVSFWPFTNVSYNYWDENLYTAVEILCFVLEAISLWRIVAIKANMRDKIKNIILFCISSWVLLFTNSMGAFKLSYLLISGLVVFFAVFLNSKYSKRKKIFGILAFSMFVFLTLYIDFSHFHIVENIFSVKDIGNLKRTYQIRLIFDRFKFWGNGLGAEIKYTFAGKCFDSYAVEVSYLNIVDKYGIFSLLILFIFLETWVLVLRGLIKKKENREINIMALGACSYMIIAIGNPVIFSAYNVLIHCIILYLVM